ncbi:uncharacterized protein LOC142150580 [Mixophyes fleayi]|uniref:uncharacterized protein LOC142150580 n=1 Tax=Mixophyes fleayi TaxID=3061075 RepID=UPI003F4E178D
MVGNPKEQRTATIRIHNLRKSDGPMFCCRVTIENPKTIIEKWQNPMGTFINFKDQFSVEQPDIVPSIVGENITIPCNVSNKSTDTIREVTWKVGTSDKCSDYKDIIGTWTEEKKSEKIGRWSVVNFPNDLSLHIRAVTLSDSKRYCCEVKKRTRGSVTGSVHGTWVEVAASKNDPELITHQSTLSVELEDSVTINCSFSIPTDRDPMWIGIYWRVGSPSNIYAYHPYKEMVHSSYKGRTELRGLADLHIKGVQETDYTTYYCFALLKFCVGNNIVDSEIHYGSPTTLNTKRLDSNQQTLIIAIAVALLIVIILCVIFIVLKKKGIICRKERKMEDMNFITPEPEPQSKSVNMEMTSVEPSENATGQEDYGGIHYARLNMTSLQQGKANRNNPDKDSQVLYAAVKPNH